MTIEQEEAIHHSESAEPVGAPVAATALLNSPLPPPPPESTTVIEEKKSVEEQDEEKVVEVVEETSESASEAPFGTALLTGGRRSGPLLAKLSSWGKQANSNAKDLFAKRFQKSVSTPVGGILGSALETAQLEEPSPTKSPLANDGPATSPTTTPPSSPPRHERHDSLLDDASSEISDRSSSYFSSAYTESADGSGVPNLKNSFRWAAASVVDSVQTYRGRYNTSSASSLSSPVPLVQTLSTASTASQTQRILQSRAREHLAHLMEGLEPHEYIMLLGQGLLGVNLKATYLQNRGVYVDYLVPHGAAYYSQVIQPGDVLLRVGDQDVQRSTIYKIPAAIAAAPRPVHLVLATGLPAKHLFQLNHVDVAVAMLHQWQRAQQHPSSNVSTPSRSNVSHRRDESFMSSPSRMTSDDEEDEILHPTNRNLREGDNGDDHDTDDDSRGAVADLGRDENVVSLVHPTSFDSCDNTNPFTAPAVPPLSDVMEANQHKAWFWLPPPSTALRASSREDAARRCSDLRVTSSGVATEASLDRVLQYALLEVVVDYRKRSFWERHIKTLAAVHPDKPPPEALLVLFLELWDFGQYFHFMDETQRATTVHRIAHTYFVPTIDEQVGLVPPLIDFHTLVGDASLREMEAVLKHQKPLTQHVWRDCFEAAVAELARDSFLQFLQSEECARMRGHLRHTAPFWNVSLPTIVERLCGSSSEPQTVGNAQNYTIYLLTFLLCQTDNEGIGELIDLDDPEVPRTRIEGAANGFCAALFIMGAWLSAIRSGSTEAILAKYNQLWETYLSPSVGCLAMTSLSTKASQTLGAISEKLQEIRSRPDAGDTIEILPLLVDDDLVNRIHELAKDLLYDYARNTHPKFTVHKFHEWMCQEALKLLSDEYQETFEQLPRLPPGSIKRFLRKVEFPSGISTHKPTRHVHESNSSAFFAAECAVVFGNSVGLDLMGSMENDEDTRRYICESLVDSENPKALLPESIPPTLESYASIPVTEKQPLSNFVNQHWISQDGWEIALVNFVLPRTDVGGSEGGDGSLYGVSLVFQRSLSEPEERNKNTLNDKDVPTQFCVGKVDQESTLSFDSTDGSLVRKVVVDGCDVSGFNACLRERTWRERIEKEVRPDRAVARVGIALVSQNNAILSMRETLSALLRDFSRSPGDNAANTLVCGPLVDVLGNFSNQDVDFTLITSLLRPYLQHSSKSWVDRPVSVQRDEFEKIAGEQLVNSLPPIAIAMMFVTALLEQKIVITSSRRGLLLSATTALKRMLQPLKWCHLMVPRVPANLIADLIQYPAPFVLGLPSDEPGVLELIKDLPDEITLVDLDVGRVILAPSFAHANELSRVSCNESDTRSALRTQVLYLAQSLGSVFGASIDGPLWACDRPLVDQTAGGGVGPSRFDRLLTACHAFVEELLAGTTSCCYWIEEAIDPTSEGQSRSDPTVFFDEDHFFHLKNKRSHESYEPLLGTHATSAHLSLALEDFDLFFELFLRCQSMSMYIGTLDKSLMVYSS